MTCIFCGDNNMTWYTTNAFTDVFKCINSKCEAKVIIRQQSNYENKFEIVWDKGKNLD